MQVVLVLTIFACLTAHYTKVDYSALNVFIGALLTAARGLEVVVS